MEYSNSFDIYKKGKPIVNYKPSVVRSGYSKNLKSKKNVLKPESLDTDVLANMCVDYLLPDADKDLSDFLKDISSNILKNMFNK